MKVLKVLQTIIAIHKMITESHVMNTAEAHFNHPNTYPAKPVASIEPVNSSSDDEDDEETPFQQMCAKHAVKTRIDECIDEIVTNEANRVAGKILKRLGK